MEKTAGNDTANPIVRHKHASSHAGGNAHGIKPHPSAGYATGTEIAETAEFIKSMNPNLRPRGRLPRPGLSIFVYAALLFIMASLLIIDIAAPAKETVTITQTVTKAPQIDDGFSIVAGEENTDQNIGITGWWNKSLETSCAGIDAYYTGMGFMPDWTDMLNVYDRYYSDGGNEPIAMRPPCDMKKNLTGYDCEDMAHATRCLASKYGTECSFWMKDYHGAVAPDTGEHLGVCCKVFGSWKCI